MGLMLHNTLTRKKEAFVPIDADHIRMYVCGPTVYNYAHIGNARPVVVFDLLAKLLRHDYPKLTYARNITDIDDKIIKAAEESGVPIRDITEKFAAIYEDDMAALNADLPDLRPKATESIPQMISMIQRLIDGGHAYAAEGHVLFNVPSMDNYGELSNRNRDEMIAGARVEVAPYKRDAADFVLWKPSSDDQPGWDSPWGRGRPGWHLECSCMIEENLGDTIDIHGGGLDLIFPHHENEIAQSRCVHDGAPLARYWMHNGYLTVNGEKMSKSLGNFFTVHELLEEYGRKAGEAIRLLLLTAHYRQPLDFTKDGIEQARKQLDRWYRVVDEAGDMNDVTAADIPTEFLDALRDDLNTPKALAVLNKLAKDGKARELKAACDLFGVLKQSDWIAGDAEEGLTAEQIDALIAERNAARTAKDFAASDRIRDELAAQGIILKDGAEGTRWERA